MAEERNETKKKPKRMAKEEIEKKKKMIMKTFFILVAVIVVGVIAFIANDYIIFDQNKKINLVIIFQKQILLIFLINIFIMKKKPIKS